MGALAVAKLMLGALFMIGKRQTWEAGGAGHRLTPRQIIFGAIVGGVVVVGTLILIVRIALTLAGAS